MVDRSVLLLEPLLHDGDGHAYSLVDGDQAILSVAGARQLRPVTCAFAAQATATLVDELENRAVVGSPTFHE